MWELKEPQLVKLIIGVLAADEKSLEAAVNSMEKEFGDIDLRSDIWPFTQTSYYKEQTGENIVKQFVSIERLINPAKL